MYKSVFWFSSTLFFHGSKDAGIVQDISLHGINWKLTLSLFITYTLLVLVPFANEIGVGFNI